MKIVSPKVGMTYFAEMEFMVLTSTNGGFCNPIPITPASVGLL